MTPERKRISRLTRLERIRAITKQKLAADAADAERVLAQLNALTERTRELASEYGSRRDPADGFALAQLSGFAAGLCEIVRASGDEASSARGHADLKMSELAVAERRRAAVEQRLNRAHRLLEMHEEPAPSAQRRRIGTELE